MLNYIQTVQTGVHMSRYYTEDHEWIEVNGNNATIGITKHATEELGEVVYVDLNDVDEDLDKGSELGSVESVKTVSGIYAPVTGTITETNEILDANPEKLNEDPEGNAWLVKMSITDTEELSSLMSESEYKATIS